jgi:hypothetical protein
VFIFVRAGDLQKKQKETKKYPHDANFRNNGLSDTNINIMITENIRRLLCP